MDLPFNTPSCSVTPLIKATCIDIDASLVNSTRRLNILLANKVPLKNIQTLTNLYLYLASRRNISFSLIQLFADTASSLLRLVDSTFTVDWFPIYTQIKYIMYPKSRDRLLPSTLSAVTSLCQLVNAARDYFVINHVSVLQEFLPQIDLSINTSHSFVIQSFIFFFIKTNTPDCSWLPTLFNLWHLNGNSNSFDQIYFDVLAKLSQDQIATPENVSFTRNQIKVMFTAAARSFNVPVGTHPVSNGNTSNNTTLSTGGNRTVFENIAVIIVSTIYPKPILETRNHPDLDVMSHLTAMITSLENYLFISLTQSSQQSR